MLAPWSIPYKTQDSGGNSWHHLLSTLGNINYPGVSTVTQGSIAKSSNICTILICLYTSHNACLWWKVVMALTQLKSSTSNYNTLKLQVKSTVGVK